jgi:hypothetical protein
VKIQFVGYRDVHRQHNGRDNHWLGIDHLVLVDRSQVRICEPHKFSQLEWFNLQNRPDDDVIHSILPNFFKKYWDEIEKFIEENSRC